MVRNFRIAGTVAAVAVIAGLALAQVKVIDGTSPPSSTPSAPRTPGQLASAPTDPDVEISPAGEPIVIHVPNIVVPALVTDKDGNIMNKL